MLTSSYDEIELDTYFWTTLVVRTNAILVQIRNNPKEWHLSKEGSFRDKGLVFIASRR